MRKIGYVSIISICTCFAIACGRSRSASDRGSLVTIRPIIGSKFYFNNRETLRSTVKIGDQKHESDRSTEVSLIYEVLRAGSDTIALKVTYDKLHLVMHNDGQEKEITGKAATATDDPLEVFLRSLLGSSITVYLDPRGNVQRASGFEEISGKILGSMGLANEKVRDNVRLQMNKMIGEEFIRDVFQQNFRLFPDTAVRVGDSWSWTSRPFKEVGVGMNTSFSLHSINGSMARIDIRSDLAKSEDTVNIMGYQAIANLDGNQRGRFDIDTATGLPSAGETQLSLEGKIQVMGRDMPVTIRSERTIESKSIR